VEIFKEFIFEAAHRLPNVPPGHKCARLHGHLFRVSIHVRGAVGGESDWVMDFGDINAAFQPLYVQLDHYYLNEIAGLENPTSEVLAGWICERLRPALHATDFRVAVETQGSVYRAWLERCDLVTISPKPPSSGLTPNLSALDRFVALPNANFKVVVFDEIDFQFAKAIHLRYLRVPFYLQVGNAIGKDTAADLLAKLDWLAQRTIADPEMASAVVLPQLHVLLYGNRRGV